MRPRVRTYISAAILVLVAAVPGRAGVYISGEIRPLNEYRLNKIKAIRSVFQSLALPPKSDDSDREKYLRQLGPLEVKAKAHELTDQDRADLGGLYLRFGRPRDAVRILSEGGSKHFLVLCNLAVANHELATQESDLSRMEEAVLTERRALAAWPEFWPGWSHEQWWVYRRAERLQLRLLEVRFREMRLAEGKQPVWQTVDDLFPGFRAVGPSGSYEAGCVSLASVDALGPDAAWLVRELIFAYPTDARLYWLFGELLNAASRVEDAYQVLDGLLFVNQLSNVREIVAHRRVLGERAGLIHELRKTEFFRPDVEEAFGRVTDLGQAPVTQEDILWALSPPAPFGAAVAGSAAATVAPGASSAVLQALRVQERLGRPPPLPTLASKPSVADDGTTAGSARGESSGALPDWRVLATGFAAGVLLTVVVTLQRNEWKRRRQPALPRR